MSDLNSQPKIGQNLPGVGIFLTDAAWEDGDTLLFGLNSSV